MACRRPYNIPNVPLEEIECDKGSVTSPTASRDAGTGPGGRETCHSEANKSSQCEISNIIVTAHSRSRRAPVKHCASEPAVDLVESVAAAISAAAAESVAPSSSSYRARKKFAEIKSATQGDRRSSGSAASSHTRPGKVSPSKRTETEKSEKGSKGRQRRRRSLSLCESFSDGESTEGEFNDKELH